MRALVKTAIGPGNIELRDVPVPRIQDDEVLLKVELCGICGSDLHIEDGVHDVYPPVILGHEFVGTVAQTGSAVTTLRPGDAASFFRSPSPFPGYRVDGAFAEYMRIKACCLWKTPEGISPEVATQFETVRVPIDLVRDVVGVRPGDRVVVSGPGQVGLLAVNMARLEGASRITVLGGPGDAAVRLPKAIELGANRAEEFGPEALSRLTGADAPTCWIESSGSAAAIKAAVDCIAYGGRIAVSGIGRGPWELNMWKVARQNILIRGRWGGQEHYVEASVPLIRQGRLKVAATITDVMPLSRWQAAFARLRARQAIKILLDPSR